MLEPSKSATPRRAAAGLLVRQDRGLEILLARRNQKLRFMGGHHVFPGGSVHENDDPACVQDAPDDETGRAICAAVREVFEETGLLCARGGLPPIETLRQARRGLISGETSLAAVLRQFGLSIHAADFTPAGAWLTPKWSPVRFQTRYFLYRYTGPPQEEIAAPDSEIVGLDWLTPAEARRRWHAGELRLSTPVAFVLRYLAKLPLDEALPRLADTSVHSDHIPNLFEMRRGVHILPLRSRTLPPNTHTNCVIIGEEEMLVIDPGAADEAEQEHLRQHLEAMRMLGGRVRAVVLTHGHQDHCAAAPFVSGAFDAPLWGHASIANEVPFPIARGLEDGEVIEVGGTARWRLRCHRTPGHDPGHLCFLEETTGTLIVGDMLANPGPVLIDRGEGGDMTVYLEQLERLRALSFHLLIPAHGLPLWGSGGRDAIAALIAHRLDRERRIRDALDRGAQTLDAILESAYDDTPRELWPYARRQIKSHLHRLGVALDNAE